jgi:DNA (cytosine-5)-methyltransferase 1
MKPTPLLTFGSLFAGIGGFDLGFERAGMVCKWQVEIDDYANGILAKHWPDVPRYRDVRAFPPRPESPWLGGDWRKRFAVNVVIGGFPCQDISYAGKGAGLAGDRSGLFFQAVRVVRELRPEFVVLENVAALLTRGLDRVLGTLAEVGYDAEWHCVSAASVGAPHIRERLFILAYSKSDGREQGKPDIGGGAKGIGPGKKYRSRCSRSDVANSGRDRSRGTEEVDGDTSFRSERIIGVAGGCWWETEPDVGRVANGIPDRVDRLRGLGNAIVPQVAEVVANRVIELAG